MEMWQELYTMRSFLWLYFQHIFLYQMFFSFISSNNATINFFQIFIFVFFVVSWEGILIILKGNWLWKLETTKCLLSKWFYIQFLYMFRKLEEKAISADHYSYSFYFSDKLHVTLLTWLCFSHCRTIKGKRTERRRTSRMIDETTS